MKATWPGPSLLSCRACWAFIRIPPLNVLFLDPRLPDWLPEIIVENLWVGKARVTLRFQRNQEGGTDYTVAALDGDLHILRQPSPCSLTSGWGERVTDAVWSLIPGK